MPGEFKRYATASEKKIERLLLIYCNGEKFKDKEKTIFICRQKNGRYLVLDNSAGKCKLEVFLTYWGVSSFLFGGSSECTAHKLDQIYFDDIKGRNY